MDRLAAMRTFVEIVDRGSLTAAAEALDRSQPTVVRTLAALERHLGALLLRRTTRRMSLTPEGQDYLARCRRILADVVDAERAIGQDVLEPVGSLRMTAPIEFGSRHIAPAISAFLARHERVHIDLLLVDRNVDLIDEGLDLALRIGPLNDSSMIAVRVGDMRRVTVASPALLQEAGAPERPGALSQLPCIRLQNIPRTETHWPFQDRNRNIVVPVDGRFGCNQIGAAISACVAGAGFGQFLFYQVRDLINDGTLQVVLADYERTPVPVSLFYPGGRLVSSRLRALLDWLKDTLQNSDAVLHPG